MRCSIDSSAVSESSSKRNWLRKAYDWTLAWADHPQAQNALFFIALIEASIFPIPPDVLLIALALGRPDMALRFAAITTAGSTVGAVLGFCIGMFLFAGVAEPILSFYGAMDQFAHVQELFLEHGIWVVLIAGFSPIPFKVITIASGAFHMPFVEFLAAAIVSRAARFYMEGALLRWGGLRLRMLVEKHFELLTVSVTLLVVAGFVGLWLLK